MGGEKGEKGGRSHEQQGSPPHGRGKVINTDVPGHGLGITPAWAGKSLSAAAEVIAPVDHPRMGGEKTSLTKSPKSNTGSPPHGRGKVGAAVLGGGCLRITPA